MSEKPLSSSPLPDLSPYSDGILRLWAALQWGWIVAKAHRTLLTGGLDLGPALGGVPVLVWGVWAALFGAMAARRSWVTWGAAGLGASGWLVLTGYGVGALLGPVAATGFLGAQRLLLAIAPEGSGRFRVRLLLTTVVLGMVGLAYLLWLAVLTALLG